MSLTSSSSSRFLAILLAAWGFTAFIYLIKLNGDDTNPVVQYFLPHPLPKEVNRFTHHPVETLVEQAKDQFAQLMNSQSTTLEEAKNKYRKRYSRDPPPGFDKWFYYAKAKQSIIIDDYDTINDNLEPFWNVAPGMLQENIENATKLEHLALRKCGFKDGSFFAQGDAWIVTALGRLLDEVAHDIPDVGFAMNVIDEPRAVFAEDPAQIDALVNGGFRDESHHSIWEEVVNPCPRSRPRGSIIKLHDHSIPFVQDAVQAKNICQHPEYSQMHGIFSSPASCLLTSLPIPILSQAAPSTFGDILHPSPWYTEKQDQGDYRDDQDPPWEVKSDTLYWAGSTTGSHSINGSWKHSHRQRFVQLVQSLNDTQHEYLNRSDSGTWKGYQAMEDHSALFNVKLTAAVQCDDSDCEAQRRIFNISPREDSSHQFQSRFVFDIDGNSFSGRFYTLLQSRSVVFKQTVFKEWHDERLAPWVHYVPVGLAMEELPELMRYFTDDKEGRRIAREIAESGREWFERVLRREDFTVYLYRLMLEMARVLDLGREAG